MNRRRRRNYSHWIPSYRNPRRRGKRGKWITRAKRAGRIKKGALHRTLKRWYGHPMNKKIPASMLAKAYRRAQRTGNTKVMRQINLARTFKKMRRRKGRGGKVIRGVSFRRRTRRRVANPAYTRKRRSLAAKKAWRKRKRRFGKSGTVKYRTRGCRARAAKLGRRGYKSKKAA